MRKVFLVSTAFQEEYEVGFANGLFRNGVPVTVIGSDRSFTERLDNGISFLNLRGSQVSKRSAFHKFLNILRYLGALAKTARANRSAIFHNNGIFTLRRGPGVLFEALWCRLSFREWWLTVHNLLPHDNESRINRIAFGTAYKLADRLFVHTEAVATALTTTFGIPPEKIRVIEHGIDRFIDIDAHSKTRIREKLSLPPFSKLLLLFGNISRYKGVDLLVDAAAKADLPPDTLILIAGRSSDPGFRAELEDKLSPLKERCNILWRNTFIADKDIADLLSAADWIVLPYRKIDQSGVVFSAKSAGLPMLVSDVGSFRNYVEAGHDILIPPNDLDALADALRQAALKQASIEERQKFVGLAREKYAWQFTLREYAALIKSE